MNELYLSFKIHLSFKIYFNTNIFLFRIEFSNNFNIDFIRMPMDYVRGNLIQLVLNLSLDKVDGIVSYDLLVK